MVRCAYMFQLGCVSLVLLFAGSLLAQPAGVDYLHDIPISPEAKKIEDRARIVNMLGSATQAIRSFDVQVSQQSRRHWNAHLLVWSSFSTNYHYEKLSDHEIRWSQFHSHWRQVRAADGRWRIETAARGPDNLGGVILFNGEHYARYSQDDFSAYIGPVCTLKFQSESEYVNLVGMFKGELDGVGLVAQRDDVAVVAYENPDGTVVIEIPRDLTAPQLKAFAFRIQLDPIERAEGYRITQVDRFYEHHEHGKVLDQRLTIDYGKVPGGLTVPVEGIAANYIHVDGLKEQLYEEVRLVVDVDESTWNTPIPDSEFDLVIPQGARVRDARAQKP